MDDLASTVISHLRIQDGPHTFVALCSFDIKLKHG